MTRKEKKLLLFAVLVFAIYAPFQLWPWAGRLYQAQDDKLEQLRQNIQRYQRLEEQGQVWQAKHQEILAQRAEIESSLLQGSTRELVAARLQGLLKEAAQQAGVQVQSLELPEFTATGEWLMVTQSVRFNASSQSVWEFLRALRDSKTFLAVLSLDVRAFRNDQVNGSVKVAGFSPAALEGIAPLSVAPPAPPASPETAQESAPQ